MFRWQRPHLVLSVYGLLVSISAFITALILFQIPSDPKNIIFLGFSLQRLIMVGGVSLVGVLLAVFAVKTYRDETWAGKVWFSCFGREMSALGIRWGAVAGMASGWIAHFTPLYRWGNFQDYYLRVSPLVIWLIFISALTFVVAWIEKYGFHWQRVTDNLRAQRKVLLVVLIAMVIFILTWVLIAWTGVGLRINFDYWYGAGVPLLELQVVLAFLIGVGVLFLERSSVNIRIPAWSDILVFVLLWGVAAFLWVREPMPASYFATGPDLPNAEYYPFSDAATFDLGSQFALIGQGINNGLFFDRVLYMFFLLFLHAFVGQNYVQVVAVQAAIYAVFPAILYLLGKAIHSRSFGIILAVLTILRGINGIASGSMIDLANQKQMLTDFPVAIFAAWFALMAVKWLQAPNKNYPYALWAGGAVGLAVMLRTHALFLLLFAVLLAAVVYWKQKLRGLLISFMLVAAMFVVILPWGIHGGGSMFDVFMVRIRNVIEGRYLPPTPEPQGNASPLFSAAIQNNESASLISYSRDYSSPSQSLNDIAETNKKDVSIFVLVASHFLHNIITSILIMPTSPVFHDLRNTLKVVTPFWQPYWDGNLGVNAGFFLMVNLLLIALGIGVSWRSNRLGGLVPLGAFLFYNLANAVAQTSGGRYIVPVDWVIFFYFALGLLQIILWGMALFGVDGDSSIEKTFHDLNNMRQTSWTWKPLKQAPWIILVFLLIGTSMPLSEGLFPKQYSARSQAELLAVMEQEGYLREAGLDRATVNAVSAQWPVFKVMSGRVLYPRYYPGTKGEPKNRFPYGVLDFPRIAFTMIGPDGLNYVLLPEEHVPFFPNAADVIVLGCQENDHIDALVVVIEEQQVVYMRQPASSLQCPLQQPVCNSNHVCR